MYFIELIRDGDQIIYKHETYYKGKDILPEE